MCISLDITTGATPDEKPPPPVALNCDPIGLNDDEVDIGVGDRFEPTFALWFSSNCDNRFQSSSLSFSFRFSLFKGITIQLKIKTYSDYSFILRQISKLVSNNQTIKTKLF